jgi:hypothetical protein
MRRVRRAITGALSALLPSVLAAQELPPDPTAPAARGAVAVKAIQGTPDGPPIRDAQVELRLVAGNEIVHKASAPLDEHGVIMFEDLPLETVVMPFVFITYRDVVYRGHGVEMSPHAPQQRIDVTCYETTEKEPDWHVASRRVMLSTGERGVRVTEQLLIENPASKTWVGSPSPAGERTVTFAVELPATARDLKHGRGLEANDAATVVNGRLIGHVPLKPGTNDLIFGYVLPVVDERAELELVAPALVAHTSVVLPVRFPVFSVRGLVDQGVQESGDMIFHAFNAQAMKPGERAQITLAASEQADEPVARVATVVALAGSGLILVVAVLLIIVRSRRHAEAGTS